MINCEKLRVNLAQKNVDFFTIHHTMCKYCIFKHSFRLLSRSLFNNKLQENHTNTFSHFHSPYYNYYDIFSKNNYNYRKD